MDEWSSLFSNSTLAALWSFLATCYTPWLLLQLEPSENPDVLSLIIGVPATLCRRLVLTNLAPEVSVWLHPHGLSTQDLIGLTLRGAPEQADYQIDTSLCSFSSVGWVGHGTATSHPSAARSQEWQQHREEECHVVRWPRVLMKLLLCPLFQWETKLMGNSN